jgi:hypothetical protein
MNDLLRNGILATAAAVGANPVDLATAISYETGGTFNPLQAGPTTQWGQHRGLIQFGEPQAKQYGVNWDDPLNSQLGPNGAIANYLRASGFKPGMSGMDLYSTINAGAPGRYGASDANNGGAPGTVQDKWNQQMAGHRQKAEALLGGSGGQPSAIAAEVAQLFGGASPAAAPTSAPAAAAQDQPMTIGGVPLGRVAAQFMRSQNRRSAEEQAAQDADEQQRRTALLSTFAKLYGA